MSPQVGVVVDTMPLLLQRLVFLCLVAYYLLRSQFATLKPRKPIGFIQPEENDEEDKEGKK